MADIISSELEKQEANQALLPEPVCCELPSSCWACENDISRSGMLTEGGSLRFLRMTDKITGADLKIAQNLLHAYGRQRPCEVLCFQLFWDVPCIGFPCFACGAAAKLCCAEMPGNRLFQQARIGLDVETVTACWTIIQFRHKHTVPVSEKKYCCSGNAKRNCLTQGIENLRAWNIPDEEVVDLTKLFYSEQRGNVITHYFPTTPPQPTAAEAEIAKLSARIASLEASTASTTTGSTAAAAASAGEGEGVPTASVVG